MRHCCFMSDLYETLTQKANMHRLLYHYTSIESLEIILKNKSLRLSRLDQVNDPKENQRITSLWKGRVFVACFTNCIDNEMYFFENYGPVRITFLNNFCHSQVFIDSELTRKMLSFKTDYNSRSDMNLKSYDQADEWCIYDASFSDIYYTDDLDMHIAKDGDESNAGLIKTKIGLDKNGVLRDWSVEKESRLRLAVRTIAFEPFLDGDCFKYPNPPFEYLFISIDNLILKIELFDGCTETVRKRFHDVIKKYFS